MKRRVNRLLYFFVMSFHICSITVLLALTNQVKANSPSIVISNKEVILTVGVATSNSYSISYTGFVPDGYAFYSHDANSNSYGIGTSPPSGLSFSNQNGLISGVPTQAASRTQYWILDGDGNVFDYFFLTVRLPSPEVLSVTSPTADGVYTENDVVLIHVTFSETVTVDTSQGSPVLNLETGNIDRAAEYVSGSNSTELIFRYTVQSGDTSSDLDVVDASSLVLNGSQILDTAQNAANLTLASPGATGSLGASSAIAIDAVSPDVVITRGGQNTLSDGDTDVITFTLTESSGDFSMNCIEITGGTLSQFSGSGSSYSVVATPNTNTHGDIEISVKTSSFHDAAGNINTNRITLQVPYDTRIVSNSVGGTVTPDNTQTNSPAIEQAPAVEQSAEPAVTRSVAKADQSVLPSVGISTINFLIISGWLFIFTGWILCQRREKKLSM